MSDTQMDSLAELQKLYQEMMEPLAKTQLKHGIYHRVRAIDERLNAVKMLASRWVTFSEAVGRAVHGKPLRASGADALLEATAGIAQAYPVTLPLLEHPHCGKTAIAVCRDFTTFEALCSKPPDHLQKLQKSCSDGAKLLKEFQSFLLGVRREVVSMNRLRYAFEYYAEFNWRRALPAVGAVVVLFAAVWIGVSYYLGKAAPVGLSSSSGQLKAVVTMSAAAAARTASTEKAIGTAFVVTIRGRFGGTSDLVITAEGLRWEHRRWAKPGDNMPVLVNEAPWQPAWSGKTSDLFPVKMTPCADVTVTKIMGRGTARIVEANDQRVVVRVADSGLGADSYAVSIACFKKTEPAPPAAGGK